MVRSTGEGVERKGKKIINAGISRQGLDIKASSSKYERIKQERTNLIVDVVEVQDGTGELDMDDIPPDPEHRRTVSDIGDVSGPHAAGGQRIYRGGQR